MENKENRQKGKSLRFRIFNYILLVFIIVGIGWVITQFVIVGSSRYTNNAQVKRHIVPVNSRVQGYIKDIRFEEYQHVNKGDTLLIIDDAEYVFRLAQAEANYANALAGRSVMGSTISTTYNNLSVSDAGIEEVKVRLEHAATNLRRYQNLLAQEAVTQDQYDRIKTEYDATKAKYDMLVRQKKSTALMGEEQTKRLSQNDANIKQAKAALDMAELNLSYTVITAPCDGIVGRKDLQIGQLIQPGQSIVSVVDDSEVWVVANFKEKQTKNIALGDIVEIDIDAIPDVKFTGKVSAISQATGSAFSLVPTDNSTGNFVKVEQRIPVRLELTGENAIEDIAKLKAGMSAEVYVKSN
ncbi:MAG: HlyD family secretion protein [Dysgonomonas sp.]|nr:HlyD family secretion protein [Dysgonomonas sp.]